MSKQFFKPFILFLSLPFWLISCQKDDVANIEPQPEPVNVYNVNQAELVKLVNNYRTAGCVCGTKTMPPVPAIKWNNKLADAALAHSKDMKANNYFSHSGLNGSSVGTRVTQAGYIWSMVAENIAMGYKNETAVMDGWIKSPGHCENIMRNGVMEMGVGRDGDYWTKVFGAPR